MLGEPELSVALARITRPLDAGSVTVVDADPVEVSARACPPDALLSVTTRPELDGERISVSSSMGVVVVVEEVDAVAVVLAAAAWMTALLRRVEPSPIAARVSAGSVGVLSEAVSDTEYRAVVSVGAIDELATGGEVMGDEGGLSGSVSVDVVTAVTAGARWVARLPDVALVARLAALGPAVLWEDLLVPAAVDPVDECEADVLAGPADEELEPPSSAWQTAQLSPVAIAVPIPKATASVPIRPTARSTLAIGQ